jgi:DNA-repair protein complementing XP-A cells
MRLRDEIQPAQKFTKYVEYDFSKMTDTKGGFLTAEDDPHNKALHASGSNEEKPAHMTLKEWERHQLLRSLRDRKTGPFEPALSILADPKTQKACYECGSLEIDWKWEDVFGCRVCNACKEKLPEKYSLLTKTEAREDYLLTDRTFPAFLTLARCCTGRRFANVYAIAELKDEELLPHLERPNPHKATWNNMMLYLRYQVEEYAFSPKKWGSPEALDAEFAKRESDKKKRKENKFRTRLRELKKRTQVEAYRRSKAVGGGGGDFGDDVGQRGKHIHQWGRTVDNPETGMGVKTCVDCGMEVEELEF